MARRLRVLGSTSGVGDCPTLYEDMDSKEVLVQGEAVIDPDDVAQLRHIKDGEGFVVVPRALLVDFAPREAEDYVPEFVPQKKISEFINDGFEHTAWRLETRLLAVRLAYGGPLPLRGGAHHRHGVGHRPGGSPSRLPGTRRRLAPRDAVRRVQGTGTFP